MSIPVQIQVRKQCAACGGTGKIPSSDKTWDNLPTFYEFSYCPACKGEGHFDEWTLLSEALLPYLTRNGGGS